MALTERERQGEGERERFFLVVCGAWWFFRETQAIQGTERRALGRAVARGR